MNSKKRSIIVTGGGQGIGAAIARDLSAHGARIVVADLNEEKAATVAAEIETAEGSAIGVRADVGDPDSVEAMAQAALAAHGRLDGLINCAAIFSTIKMKRFEEISLEDWEAVMRVNTTGTFLACKAVAGPMREAGFGLIINFSSQAVTRGRVDYLHYIASKSAIIGMTRSLARELGEDGITVNAILPGYTQTEVPRETTSPAQQQVFLTTQSIKRFGTPADIVGLVRFLCSEEAGFITGQCHAVDGGLAYP